MITESINGELVFLAAQPPLGNCEIIKALEGDMVVDTWVDISET